jgi:hypothetical protein
VDSVKYAKAATSNGWLDAGMRAGEDIVLTNVISFDIKVWNPDTNSFTNLGEGTGAFGSQGRYSKETGENEILVQRVYFDENMDRSKKYDTITDPSDPNVGTTVEVRSHHDISPDYPQRYLYREGSNGQRIPLSPLPADAVPTDSSLPPLPQEEPKSTLVIGAWSGDPMSRVFDTWTKWYESQLRNGGDVPGLSNLYESNGDPKSMPQPPTTFNKIDDNNSNITGTEFWLVTLGFEQLDNQPMNRWYYLHSPNEHEKIIPGADPGDPPTITTELRADKFFMTYQHPGTGIILSDKNSGKYWESPPPYDEVLRGVEITIRCFDPKSGNIRQVRIVKHVDL